MTTLYTRSLIFRLTPLFQSTDPCGLLRIGAPVDEYETEIEAVAASRYRIHSPEDAGRVVEEVFAFFFECAWQPLPPSQLALFAESVWAAVLECDAEQEARLAGPQKLRTPVTYEGGRGGNPQRKVHR